MPQNNNRFCYIAGIQYNVHIFSTILNCLIKNMRKKNNNNNNKKKIISNSWKRMKIYKFKPQISTHHWVNYPHVSNNLSKTIMKIHDIQFWTTADGEFVIISIKIVNTVNCNNKHNHHSMQFTRLIWWCIIWEVVRTHRYMVDGWLVGWCAVNWTGYRKMCNSILETQFKNKQNYNNFERTKLLG